MLGTNKYCRRRMNNPQKNFLPCSRSCTRRIRTAHVHINHVSPHRYRASEPSESEGPMLRGLLLSSAALQHPTVTRSLACLADSQGQAACMRPPNPQSSGRTLQAPCSSKTPNNNAPNHLTNESLCYIGAGLDLCSAESSREQWHRI